MQPWPRKRRTSGLYKKIIVPVALGHTDVASGMIAVARKLADGAPEIVLTHIVEELPTYVAAEIPGGYQAKLKSAAVEELTKVAERAGIKAEIDVRTGYASSTILTVAEEHKADAIVIASHRPGLEDYFLGSTAARVVRHAKCTVVVLR